MGKVLNIGEFIKKEEKMATFGSTSGRVSSKRSNFSEVDRSKADFEGEFEKLLVGQPQVIKAVVPHVEMFDAGLSPEGRPAGVFLLLGPTGTGKTRSVEALASAVHGSARHLLRVDCGEYQMDHEVAKLVGSPPGYLGHRETQPLLSQARINSVASEGSSLSIILFDEIEKAAPAMHRMLLGIMDRGILRLGDNNLVNLERCMIFLTSNLGADKMQREFTGSMGFAGAEAGSQKNIESACLSAAKKKFSPEFMNRIDRTIQYRTLGDKDLQKILELQIKDIQRHLDVRLGARSFELNIAQNLKDRVMEDGVSREYGARELRRAIQKLVLFPLSEVINGGQIPPGSSVTMRIKGPKILVTIEEDAA